jgi:hypothetical protein
MPPVFLWTAALRAHALKIKRHAAAAIARHTPPPEK